MAYPVGEMLTFASGGAATQFEPKNESMNSSIGIADSKDRSDGTKGIPKLFGKLFGKK
jgi:hypothetical protein